MREVCRTCPTDYQEFTVRSTPEAERRKLDVGDIWQNKAKCLKCGWYIRSKNRHDYVSCKCGALSVDGGSWYAKRVYAGTPDDYEDHIEYYEDAK